MGLDLLQLEVGPLRVENGAAGSDGHVGEGILAVVSEALGMEKKNSNIGHKTKFFKLIKLLIFFSGFYH